MKTRRIDPGTLEPGSLLPGFLRADLRRKNGAAGEAAREASHTGVADADLAPDEAPAGDVPLEGVSAEDAFAGDAGPEADPTEDVASELDVHAAAAAELYSAGCRIAIFAAHRLHALKGYKRLGYRDAASYATEELGIRARRFRTMVRLGKRLRRLPEIRHAFLRRQITWVQAEVLAGIATPDDEAEWIDSARRRTVRQLKSLVKVARAARRRRGSPDGPEADARPSASGDPTVDSGDRPSDREGQATSGIGTSQSDEGRSVRRRLASPGWLLERLHEVKPLLETVAGHDVPEGVAVELMAAEFLSGAEARLSKRSRRESIHDSGESIETASRTPGESNDDDRSVPVEPYDDWSSSCESSDGDRPPSGEWPPDRPEFDLPDAWADLGPDAVRRRYGALAERLKEYRSMQPLILAGDPRDFCTKDTPWRLHRMLLKGVIREREVSWQLGRMLREIKERQLWRPLGYRGFVHYVGERLGISLRTAQRLIRLDLESASHPVLTEAYRAGRLPLLKATILLRALKIGGAEDAWVRYANAMTYQRLCDAIRSAEAAAARDPVAWRRSGGRPPAIPELRAIPESPEGAERAAKPADAPTFVTEARAGSDVAPAFVTGKESESGEGPESPFETTPVEGSVSGSPVAPTFVTDPDPDAERLARSFGLEPYPEGWARQRAPFRVDLYLDEEQDAVLERAFACIREIRGAEWPDWACLNDLLDHFAREYGGGRFQAMRRSFPVLDRDGWRCKVPGCRARSPLHVHHIRFRSRGGGDEPENLVTLCDFHHLALHSGIIRCRGRAPDRIYWELGPSQLTSPRFKEEAIARFFGDRRLPGCEPWAVAARKGPRPRLGMSPAEEEAYLREEASRLEECVELP